MLEAAHTLTSGAALIRDLVTLLGKRHPESQTGNNPTQTPTSRRSPVSGMPSTRTPREEEAEDSVEDMLAPSPNM